MYQTLINALSDTLVMVLSASCVTIVLGIPLGIGVAYLSSATHKFIRSIYFVLVAFLQLAKITPYLLIMIMFIPLSNWFIDHRVSYTTATIVPLASTGVLLLANKVYGTVISLLKHWQSTSKVLGANKQQELRYIILPESAAEIIKNTTHVCSLMVAFSAIAGALGAGGLGQLAIEQSIGNSNPSYVILCIAMLIALQQAIKFMGTVAIQQKNRGN